MNKAMTVLLSGLTIMVLTTTGTDAHAMGKYFIHSDQSPSAQAPTKRSEVGIRIAAVGDFEGLLLLENQDGTLTIYNIPQADSQSLIAQIGPKNSGTFERQVSNIDLWCPTTLDQEPSPPDTVYYKETCYLKEVDVNYLSTFKSN